MNLKKQEQAFLNYYISTGQNASKKIECYRLAFGQAVADVKDSSIDTYAKRILATKEAKDYMQAHRPTFIMRSEELIEAIKEMKQLLDHAKTPAEHGNIRKEIRLHLADLAKCIEAAPVMPTDEWIFSEERFYMHQPKRNKNSANDELSDKEFTARFLAKEMLKVKEPCLFYIKDGQVAEIMPFFSRDHEEDKALREGIRTGDFSIAVRK